MARTEDARERSTYRKTQRMIEQSHGGFHGKSIIEQLIDKLDHAMDCYLNAKTEKAKALCRGEVRGLARAISLMQNPYQSTRAIKSLENESASRVRRSHRAEAQDPSEAQAGDPADPGEGSGA